MLPYRIIPNNLCSYNPFKEVEVNSLEWTAFSNWFQWLEYGVEGDFTVEKPGTDTTLANWSRLTSLVTRHVEGMYPWYGTMKRSLHLFCLPSPNP